MNTRQNNERKKAVNNKMSFVHNPVSSFAATFYENNENWINQDIPGRMTYNLMLIIFANDKRDLQND